MTIIRLMEESEATGRVKEIFEEIKATLGLSFVPQLFRAIAFRADQLESVWAQVKNLFGAGTLDVKTKTLIALAVASAQRCPYFVTIHGIALKRLGATDEEMAEALEITSLCAALNTLVTGLGIEPEL